MRLVEPHSLWLGNVGDTWDLRPLLKLGINALVDLALNERPPTLTRDLVYCRFPLVDGLGNPAWVLRSAILTTTELIRANVPLLLYCSGGMSRSVAIAAAALSRIDRRPADEWLLRLKEIGPCDVSPALWTDIQAS